MKLTDEIFFCIMFLLFCGLLIGGAAYVDNLESTKFKLTQQLLISKNYNKIYYSDLSIERIRERECNALRDVLERLARR